MRPLLLPACLLALLLPILGGCIVAPVGPRHSAVSMEMSDQPTYASPGPGYAWSFNAQYGWGWRHPGYGWHRGWR
jgi:hypothetical protein